MRCLSPRTVGFKADGKTISWSPKNYSKEYAVFQLPCGKCIECRLEYARQWAVRCVHEAKMYGDNNSFITLTYSDENLKSSQLQYRDFQLFAKKLRKKIYTDFINKFGESNWDLLDKDQRKEQYGRIQIGIFVTGEYGDARKRPHWHALIFNWRPTDLVYKYSNHRGDKVYSSELLQILWDRGIAECGQVTFESAGYCARYAAKKLVHGKDGHEYEPISKKSCRQAIGKKYLEIFWQDIFNYGHVILSDGTQTSIPRYYEKWLKQHQPEAWLRYVTEIKLSKCADSEKKALRAQEEEDRVNHDRLDHGKPLQISKSAVRKQIIDQKFQQLQKHLKGDI